MDEPGSPLLALDVGGTRIKLGLVAGGSIIARDVIDARSTQGLGPQLPRIEAAAASMCDSVGLSISQCRGCTMAFASLVNTHTGRVLAEFGKYHDAMDMDLRKWCQTRLGLGLVAENDARAAMIGEWQVGAARGCDDFVMVTLGTGIGVSAIVEGQVLRGKHGQAGVMGGHLAVPGSSRQCTCGTVGCAEAEAGEARLPEMVEQLCRPQAVAKLTDYRTVFDSAAQGDRDAVVIRDHALRVWGAHAVNLIHAFDPERLIYGGGVMASAQVIVPAIQSYVDEHACTPWGRVRVIAAELGSDAALLAAPYLWEHQPTRPPKTQD